MDVRQDEFWMNQALTLARKAGEIGEIPVGAVIVHNDEVVGEGYNLKESLPMATAHAELIAIQRACEKLGRWRLSGCTLYVTLEPCVMCAGAIIQARLDRVVFAAHDLKAGALGSVYSIVDDGKLNHRPEVCSGVLASDASMVLSEFFKALRERKSTNTTGF